MTHCFATDRGAPDRRGATSWPCALVTLVALVPAASLGAQQPDRFRGEPIHYEQPTVDEPVAALRRAVEAGDIDLGRHPRHGLLPALLDALGVPVSSQTLVFSKTSFQNDRISPATPRALYFGDSVYVGYVPGSHLLELTSVDPVHGPIFYTLRDRGDRRPEILRDDRSCLRCHAFSWTDGLPGHLVRSLHVDPEGQPIHRLGAHVVRHDTPYEDRWGGWYVTGTVGSMRHMGNTVHPADLDEPAEPTCADVLDLGDRIDLTRYPSPHSDVVALLVLEHQTGMQNLIARASYEARLALHREQGVDEALGRGADRMSDTTRRILHELADDLLRYLLFRDEPPLPSPIEGSSPFAAGFAARGPKDRHGRSLRELDLRTRLFRWPCSYLIGSPEFAALPHEVRDVVMLRLHRILSGRFGKLAYRHLSEEQRQTILEILVDTVPELTRDWEPR